MFAIIAAVIFTIISIINLLLIFGAPLGEFTMGGQYKVLPKNLRIMASFSLVLQVFAILIVLQAGGFLPLWFSAKMTKIICRVFAAYLTVNTVMNFISGSKKEKYIITPLSIVAAVCFWLTAL